MFFMDNKIILYSALGMALYWARTGEMFLDIVSSISVFQSQFREEYQLKYEKFTNKSEILIVYSPRYKF